MTCPECYEVKEDLKDEFVDSSKGRYGLGVGTTSLLTHPRQHHLLAYADRGVQLPKEIRGLSLVTKRTHPIIDFSLRRYPPVRTLDVRQYPVVRTLDSYVRPVSGGNSVSGWSSLLGGYVTGTVGLAAQNNRGQTLILSNNHVLCYHPDTEILTERGFKGIETIELGESIATRSPLGLVEYEPVSRLVRTRHSGSLLRFSSRFYDVNVTPDHNMFVEAETSGKRQLMRADDFTDERAYSIGGRSGRRGFAYRFLSSAAWEGPTVLDISLPEVQYLKGKDWNVREKLDAYKFAYFLGWWLGDGSLGINSNGEHIITLRSVKDDDLTAGTNLLRSLGFNAFKCKGCVAVNSKQLHHFLADYKLKGKGNKLFPRWILSYGTDVVQALIMGYLRADGCLARTGYAIASTISEDLAYGMQEAAIRSGMSAIVRPIAGSSFNPSGRYYSITFHKAPHERHRVWRPDRNEYDDDVFCVTVPNHVILVRSRKTAMPIWCGNCGIDTVQRGGANAGAPLFQPGAYFGGLPGAETFATLYQWGRIDEVNPNQLDWATGLIQDPTQVSPQVLNVGTPVSVADFLEGMTVAKMGALSGYTVGQVIDVSATIEVNYENLFTATFDDQVIVQGSPFAVPGDSGSIAVASAGGKIVAGGLVFSGSSSIAVLNKMTLVQQAAGLALPVGAFQTSETPTTTPSAPLLAFVGAASYILTRRAVG